MNKIKCTSCGKEKNIKDFSIRTDTGKLRKQCKSCTYSVAKTRWLENRKILSNRKCKVCRKILSILQVHLFALSEPSTSNLHWLLWL